MDLGGVYGVRYCISGKKGESKKHPHELSYNLHCSLVPRGFLLWITMLFIHFHTPSQLQASETTMRWLSETPIKMEFRSISKLARINSEERNRKLDLEQPQATTIAAFKAYYDDRIDPCACPRFPTS